MSIRIPSIQVPNKSPGGFSGSGSISDHGGGGGTSAAGLHLEGIRQFQPSSSLASKSLETPVISASNEFMVMVGGQTQTTPTTILTPTFMRTFEESLNNMSRNGLASATASTSSTPVIPEIVLEAQLKHEHAAGFVPPLVQVSVATPTASNHTNQNSHSLKQEDLLSLATAAANAQYNTECIDLSTPTAGPGRTSSSRSQSFDQPTTATHQDTYHLRPTDLSLSGSFHSSPSSRRSHNSGDLSNHGGGGQDEGEEVSYSDDYGETASELDETSQQPFNQQGKGTSRSRKRSYAGGGDGVTSDDGNSNSTFNSSNNNGGGSGSGPRSKLDDDTRKKMRRERNKVAAARCRQRRVDQTVKLEEETQNLERMREALRNEIGQLMMEKDKLANLLDRHAPKCKVGGNREIHMDKIDLKPNYAVVVSHQ